MVTRQGFNSVTIRIYLKDLNKLRKVYRSQRGETMASYFQRLALSLEGRR